MKKMFVLIAGMLLSMVLVAGAGVQSAGDTGKSQAGAAAAKDKKVKPARKSSKREQGMAEIDQAKKKRESGMQQGNEGR